MKDYPTDSRKRGEEGTTGFLLTIGVDGVVSACMVVKSSGSPRLDLTTCQLAKLRARFEPAVDSEGNAEVGLYYGLLNWRLDRLRDAPLPGTVTHTFVVETDGRVTNCRIAAVTGDAKKQFRVGPETCRHTAFDRYEEPVEARKRKRVTEVETIVVSEVPATP
jgi:TonB family protein